MSGGDNGIGNPLGASRGKEKRENAAVWGLVVAAGRGTRMSPGGINKNLLPLGGRPVVAWSLAAFESTPVNGVLVVAAEDACEEVAAVARQWEIRSFVGAVPGGATRHESVHLGLEALARCGAMPEDIVLIHDGARPALTPALCQRCVESVQQYGSGVAAIPVRDTIKFAQDGWVEGTPPRSRLWAIQTPQAFRFGEISQAHLALIDAQNGKGDAPAPAEVTDDAMLMEWRGKPVRLVLSSASNLKLTSPEDMSQAAAFLQGPRATLQGLSGSTRVGQGYDVHRLVEGRPLVLGGVQIPYSRGLEGHSDADVLLHAIMDALLGAAALGDIGQHFPDTDARWKDADSSELLAQVGRLLSERGILIHNIDATVLAQRPRIAPYKGRMAARIAQVLHILPSAISIKASTTEELGFVGRQEGIAAQAVAMVLMR